jgi:(4S)-4-hydroxy-5-phosphonooxypentane-2,3-dione isomerase
MLVVTVQFEIDPQHHPAFMDEMVANARSSTTLEPGCLVFDVCEDPAQKGGVFLYEVYRDQAAFEQHQREAHFLEFDRKVAPWVRNKALKLYSRVEA